MTRRTILGLAVAVPWRAAAASLPEQTAALVLERGFPGSEVSYLLLDAASGRVICSRWEHPEIAVPVGSLVKPFTALAYGETHAFRFPVYNCLGDASHCWLPRGHGRMDISGAIAHSCNAYFLELARGVDAEALRAVVRRFGFSPPGAASTPAALIGVGETWGIAPLAIARAYGELVARAVEPGIAEVRAGLAMSARLGTGRGVGGGAYVKTGTAHCIHESREAGDGYAIALYPADAPRFNLLVRVHGVPGAKAAVVCGRMRAALGVVK
jgi:cell division protein FtsI/penicillin-binding protein 2